MATINTLVENFSGTLDPAKWKVTAVNPGDSAAFSGGMLVCSMPGTVSGQKVEIESVSTYDLTGSSIYGKIYQPFRTPNNGEQTYIELRFAPGYSMAWQLQTGGALYTAFYENYVSSGVGVSFDMFGADAATYVWFRIRESAGTVYFDTAATLAANPPAAGDWVNRDSHAVGTMPITTTKVALGVGGWDAAGAGAQTQPAKFTGLNTAATMPNLTGTFAASETSSDHFLARQTNVAPSVLPAGYVERYWRDYDIVGAISINAAQSEPGILADSGEYKMGTARYREGGQAGGTYSYFGFQGFAYDVYTDPFATAHLPAEYLLARPLGEVEPIPGVGIRLHSRPTTGPAMDSAINTQMPAAVTKAQGIGGAVWTTAQLTTYTKIAVRPPFARVSYFIPRNDFRDKHWMSTMWSTEDGNHAWPNDTLHLPFEYDDNEFLGNGSDTLASSVSIHCKNSSGATVIDATVGNYDPGSLIGQKVGVCTVFGDTDIKTYYNVNGGAWTVVATTSYASLAGAEYDQYHTAFIHGSGNGVPWLNEEATIPLAFDLVKTGIFAPGTNANLTLPKDTPPFEVTLTLRSIASGTIKPAGTVIADLHFPTDVTTASPIAYAGLLTVVGTELRLASDIDTSTQPVLNFHVQGAKASGAKSVGRLYSADLVAMSGSGGTGVTGSLAATESGSDAFSATVSVTNGRTGTFAATESWTDMFSASGKVAMKGTIAAHEFGTDTFAASGSMGMVHATLAAVESGIDKFVAAGTIAWKAITGALAAKESGADRLAVGGSVAAPPPPPSSSNPQFPATLVGKQASQFYSVEIEDVVAKAKTDGGYVVSRAKHTRQPRTIWTTGFADMTPGDFGTLRDFWNLVKGGATVFDWTDPAWQQVFSVRFVGGSLTYTYEGVGPTRRFQVQFKVEEA